MEAHPLQKISLGVDLGRETGERETTKGCILGESGSVLEKEEAGTGALRVMGMGRELELDLGVMGPIRVMGREDAHNAVIVGRWAIGPKLAMH